MYFKRISFIQKYLKENNIDAYISFINDDHGSEYVSSKYKSVSFLSAFTGSAGTLLILKDSAYLWTDGRYFLQASEQLKQSGVILKKQGIDENLIDFINENIDSLAFDFKTCNATFMNNLKTNILLIDEEEILNDLWPTRPTSSKRKIFLLPDEVCTYSIKEKCEKTLKYHKNRKNFGVLITALDDIAWILNSRGKDIPYNPVFNAFLFLSNVDNKQTFTLYIDSIKLTKQIKNKFKENNIVIKPYNKIYNDIAKFNHSVYYDENKTNFKLYSLIDFKENKQLYPTLKKAIKTKIDIVESKKAHLKDAIAMCKFIYYVKHNVNKLHLDELSVSNYLEKLRRKQGAFDLSFNTIAGYSYHGAIIHYSADFKSNIKINDDGFLLVDSGGQYYYGTTDITRTIAFKNITEEMKYHFTLALKAHIDLAMAIFDKNTTDANLDKLARRPLWDANLDYNHGTGHGVGHMLNVHEGPQNIRFNKANPIKMKKGMITSNEPGLYFEGKYGIRHENELLCVKNDKDTLKFEALTLVPFDIEAINVSMLNEDERKYLNNYHSLVYKKVAPYLNKKEKDYLKVITREI